MVKVGDKVWNKHTNMIGVVAMCDYALAVGRLEHEERTASHPLAMFVPYAGDCPPGTECTDPKDDDGNPAPALKASTRRTNPPPRSAPPPKGAA
jgi:hypothetical protein